MNAEKIITRMKDATGVKNFSKLAEILEVHPTRLYEAKKNNTIPPRWYALLYESLGINMSWLIDGLGPVYAKDLAKQNNVPRLHHDSYEFSEPINFESAKPSDAMIPQWENPDPEMFCYVPMAEAKLSAGGGAFVLSEDMKDYFAFRRAWVSRIATSSKNLVLMRITGDSMWPTLHDNDTVLLDIGRRHILDGNIYALRIDDTIMVKRLSLKVGGKIEIISDNRDEYKAYEADAEDVHVLGQIIFYCRDLVKLN